MTDALPKYMPVQPPLLLSGAEDGILFPHVHQTGQAGHRLRGDGGDGRSRHPRLEIQDQGEVQEDVQERGQGQKIHRRFAVPQRADDGGQQVVEEGGRDAHEDDEDIGIGVVDDVRRGVHHHQNVPAEQPRDHGEHQGEQGGEIGGVDHEAAHLGILFGPHPLGHDEFLKMIQLFNVDKRTFILKHRKMFEKGWYDIDSDDNELSEVDIMLCFAITSRRMAVIDWSGEEYPGQVKRSITMMLKHYGIEHFLWNTKKFEASLDWEKIHRGDYLPLLFRDMNMQLNKDGYAIVFCDTKSDCFRYAILPISEFVQFENTELGDYLTIISPKIYNIYLVDKGNEFPKIMLYLKKKFSVPLSEIKEFCSKDKILLGIGNSIIVDEYRKEIEKLGGKIEVEENRPITNSKPTE